MTLKVINPFNQTVYTECQYDTDSRLGDKIHAARRAFERWRCVPLEERIETVREGLDYFRMNKAVIAEEISWQMGKPITQSRNEFGGLFERAAHMLEIASDALAPGILPLFLVKHSTGNVHMYNRGAKVTVIFISKYIHKKPASLSGAMAWIFQ